MTTTQRSPVRAAGGGRATTPHRTNSNRNLLWLIVALAFGVSFTNLAIGQRANNIQQQWRVELETMPFPSSRKRASASHDNDISIDTSKVHDGDDSFPGLVITKILKGEKQFPEDSNSNLRLKYRPGTLQINSVDALRHCFVNVTHYKGHIADRAISLVSISDHYKIIYRNIPKSSSSSARHAMKDYLEGEDWRLKHDEMEQLVHEKNYTMISFVREPLNRFYSSYDEAFFR